MPDLRKPLAKAEPESFPVPQSTEPHSIRFTPDQWRDISEAAREHGDEPSRFVRKLTLMALSIWRAQNQARDHMKVTGLGRL